MYQIDMSGPAISKLTNNPVFVPTQISGCTLWLDSADPRTYTVFGSNVTQWRDKTANIAFQGSPISPSLSITKYNGQQPMYFGGPSYFQNTTFVFTTSSRTTFFVFDELVETNNAGVLSFASSGSDFNQLNTMAYETGLKSSSQYLQIVQGQGAAGGYALQLQSSSIGPALYEDTFSSGNVVGYVNGTQTASTSNGASFTNSTGLIIGARMVTNTISNFLTGVVGEVVLYNRPLSTSERQQVEGYLAWKWGLQGNLPASHPYKNSPFPGLSSAPIPLFPPLVLNNPLFVPTQLSGCALWLDANDLNSIVLSGNLVTQWKDKSGSNNNMLNYSLSTAPIVSRLNKLNTILFNTPDPTSSQSTPPFTNVKVLQGTNFMTSSNTTMFCVTYPLYTTTTTKFIVNLKSRNAAGWTNLYDINMGTGNGLVGGGNGSYIRTDTSLVGADASYYTINQTNLTNCSIVGTAVSFFKNGSLYNSGSVLLPMPSSDQYQLFTLGAYLNIDPFDTVSKQGCQAHFCEVIVYNGTLTTAQQQQVEGYLAWKWNIQNSLPSSHPYKNSPILGVSIVSNPVYPPQITSASFSPRQVPGIQLWLDASDKGTITTSGTTMTGWTDKSGTSKTVSFSNVNTYSASAQSVNTNNATTAYFTANIDLRFSQVTYVTVFIVHTWTGSGLTGGQALWGQDGSVSAGTGGWNRFQLLGFTGNPSLAYGLSYTPSGLNNTTTVSALNTANRLVYSATYGSSIPNGTFAYVNGTLASAVVTEQPPSPERAITYTYFGSIDSGFAGTVAFHEIVIYTTQITQGERQKVEGYLAWKWGTQGSLPGNHPYKLFPPSP